MRKPREEFMFGTEPIIGWRAWRVGPFQPTVQWLITELDRGKCTYQELLEKVKSPHLRSVNNTDVWEPGEKANCLVTDRHQAPDLQCECGYWALKSEDLLVNTASFYPDAYGTVKLWGRYCEFEKGYRAQYAAPEKIYVFKQEHVEPLARIYQCQVEFMEKRPEWTELKQPTITISGSSPGWTSATWSTWSSMMFGSGSTNSSLQE